MASSRSLALELTRQFTTIAAVPVAVTVAFIIWQLQPQLEKYITNEQQSVAYLVSEQTRQRITSFEEQIYFFVQLAMDDHDHPIETLIESFIDRSASFDALYFVDRGGLIQSIAIRDMNANLSTQLYSGVDVSQSSAFQNIDQVDHSQWTDVFLSVVTGRLSIAFLVPLEGRVLAAELAIDRLPRLSQRVSELGVLVMILDADKQLIAHPDMDLAAQQINLSSLALFEASTPSDIHSGKFSLSGKNYYGTRIKMPESDWQILVAEEETKLMGALYGTLEYWIASMGLILLIMLIVAYRRSTQFSKRFGALSNQAQKVSQGIYTKPAQELRIREFIELSENLNEMASKIEKRQLSLQTKEAQLRNTLESAPNIAIQWYDEDMRVRYWNQASETLFGFGRDEAEDHTPSELFLEAKGAEHFQRHLSEIIKHPEGSEEFEVPYKRRSGHQGRVQCTLFSIPSQEGKNLYACMLIDVTQQRQAESKLLNLNIELEQRVLDRTEALQSTNMELHDTVHALNSTMEQLVQSEKLAALGSLVAGIAHELNTPIGNARMASSTLHDFSQEILSQLSDGSIKKSSLQHYLEDALSATGITSRNLERASELISSFKQVAADQSSSQRREFKLVELVNEILITLHPQTKKKPLDISVKVDADIAMDSYPGPLGQVLSNLILNAVIHAFDEGDRGQILIAGKAGRDEISLNISDNGKGMPANVSAKIFDPFFTTRLGQGGSGLGLHIVHNIVLEVLGGTISVDSTPGTGTSFVLKIPLCAPQQQSQIDDEDIKEHVQQQSN